MSDFEEINDSTFGKEKRKKKRERDKVHKKGRADRCKRCKRIIDHDFSQSNSDVCECDVNN